MKCTVKLKCTTKAVANTFISASQKADIALPSQRFSILRKANPIIKNTYFIIMFCFGQAGQCRPEVASRLLLLNVPSYFTLPLWTRVGITVTVSLGKNMQPHTYVSSKLNVVKKHLHTFYPGGQTTHTEIQQI